MQPSLSPVDIQSHLYDSLLEARTADVSLRVRGSWEAVYRLHRVVLIQAVSLYVFLSLLFIELSFRVSSGPYLHLGSLSPPLSQVTFFWVKMG